MEEQQEAARRRVAEAGVRFSELTANFESLGLRDARRSEELASLKTELVRGKDEHASLVTELAVKLSAEQESAERNWDERCRIHAELVETTLREEQVVKEMIATRQRLADLESALRQRQEETEQTHKALGEARVREGQLTQALAAGADREAALMAMLDRSEDRIVALSAQGYAALADARSARSQVGGLAVRLRQAKDEAQIQLREMQEQLGDMRDQLIAARSSAQIAQATAIEAEQLASERLEEIARLSTSMGLREGEAAELKSLLARMGSDLNQHLVEKSELAQKLNQRQFEVEHHQATSEWLRQVHATLRSTPWWWRLVLPSWRRRLESRQLLSQGLFNEQNYLERYPEVAAAKLNPLRHYIMHGLAEGRQY